MIDEMKVVDSGHGFTIGEIEHRHKELPYLKPGALVCKFEGVDVMLNYVETKMSKARNSKASEDKAWGEFNAFDTYEEALRTFRSEPERVVKFDPSELRIKDDSESGTQVDYDVTGDYIDMGRYMEGIPESVGTMHNGNARNRRINLMVDIAQAHYMSHGDITHRGERILRLVDALEAGGVRTRLVGIESNQCGHTEIVLKQHEEPLTISDLAVVTHPEFLRRIIFRVNEHSKTWEGGYGSSVAFSEAAKPDQIEGDNVNEMNILIDGNISGIGSIDKRFDELERLLVWEMSKPIPEVSAIKLGRYGLYFNPNGARGDDEIRREGQEVINAEG